jgi:hypothetical protein
MAKARHLEPPCPGLSASQRLGQFGESLVSQQLVEHGFVFHSVSSGNDFGVDGRVECTARGGVQAEEFFVQVKTSRQVAVSKDGAHIRLRPVPLATAAYWHSKLTPTLLVVVCKASRRLWSQWALEAVPGPTLIRAIRDGKRSVIPASRLLGTESWPTIGREARQEYLRIVGAVYAYRTRTDFLTLYRSVADAYDLLFSTILGEREQPVVGAPRFPVEQVQTAILLFRALALATEIAKDAPLDSVGQRLRAVTKAAAEKVAELYMSMYATTDAEYQRAAEVALYGHREVQDKLVVLAAPADRVAVGIGEIAFCARDYLRIVRAAVFPEVPETDVPNPYMWLRDVSRARLEPKPRSDSGSEVLAASGLSESEERSNKGMQPTRKNARG